MSVEKVLHAFAEAFSAFGDDAITAMHNGTADVACIASGMQAVAWRLEEIAKESAAAGPASDDETFGITMEMDPLGWARRHAPENLPPHAHPFEAEPAGEMVEAIAAALWKEEAREGTPRSVYEGRTLEAFREQSPMFIERWMRLARAAYVVASPALIAAHDLREALQELRNECSGRPRPDRLIAILAKADAALAKATAQEAVR